MIAALESIGRHAPPASCPCFRGTTRCECQAPTERALRWIAQGHPSTPLSPREREACLAEIEAVEGRQGEGYTGASDALLASGVLNAWRTFARDKDLA